jgi:hypothetical protein
VVAAAVTAAAVTAAAEEDEEAMVDLGDKQDSDINQVQKEAMAVDGDGALVDGDGALVDGEAMVEVFAGHTGGHMVEGMDSEQDGDDN